MRQTADQYLRERLLIDKEDKCYNTMDVIISACRMFAYLKCKEQRHDCAIGVELEFDKEDGITGINMDSILNAKTPIL